MRRAASRGEKQARPHRFSLDERDGLPAGAARRRSQTAGHVVEANFRALDLTTDLVQPRASIDGADEPPLGSFRSIQLGSVHALIMPSKRRVSAGVCHSKSEGSSSTRSAKVVFRLAGSGSDHQTQFSRTFAGVLSSAVRNAQVCQSGDAWDCVKAAEISRSLRTPIMNRRGRDCGTNSAASITTAPKTYPARSKVEQIAAKSLPSCE
jgi:hypothetical protein